MGQFIFMSFGLLVVFLSLSATAADCPSDWSTYGQYCYKYFQEWMKWDKAERFCSKQAMGGHLVSIESAEEADFVAELLVQNKHRPQYYVWIGLRVQNKEKQCRSEWSDGSSFSYENLMEAYLKKCFALKGFVQWVNIYCGQHNVFICKFLRPH